MAVTKKPAGNPVRITDEMVMIWRWALDIEDEGTHERWEPEGRQREYSNLSGALNALLNVPLWGTAILRCRDESDPSWQFVEALEAAAEAEERAGRPVVRPNGNGLAESEAILNRAYESLPRSPR